LRGTPQLQNSPPAIEAFKRAAARWEPLVRTATTVVIDVDFGQALFGREFESDVVVATDAQVLGGNSLYAAVRGSLVSGPYSPDQQSFFAMLPSRSVPTDSGNSTGLPHLQRRCERWT
jgi:hypothetical protein